MRGRARFAILAAAGLALYFVPVPCSHAGADAGPDAADQERSGAGDDSAARPDAGITEEVQVREYPHRPGDPDSFSAIKSNALLRELPVSAEVFGRELMDQSQIHSFARFLDGFSLGNTSPGEGGLFEEIVLRGFTDTPYYRDGLNDSRGTPPVRELANVASVEILKGPNSAIYGPGQPGGSINFETKKPESEPFHAVSAGFGSYDRFRVEADSTGPLGGGEAFAYRLIGALEDADSFRDFVSTERKFLAPSLAWAPVQRLKLLAALEYIEHEAPFDSGVVAVEGSFPLPRDLFLGEPGIGRTRLSTLTSTLNADYESGDSWSFSASLYWQKSDADGMKVEPAELEDIDLAGSSAVLLRELQDESQSTETFAAQAELAGVIEIGRAENRVLAGYEFSSVDERVKLRGSNSEEEPFEIDIFDVEYGRELPRLSPLRDSAEFVDVHSLYVQDFVKLGERWRLLAGTRLDILDLHGRDRVASTSFSQEDSKLSSRVGIVYSPIPAVSLFASFSEALEPNEGLTPGGEPLQPTRGRGYEGGFRFRYPALSLSLDASVFRIRQTNVATDAPDDPGFEIQTAGQVSRGLDLDLFLKPAAWVQLGVKYGYNDAGIADDPEIPDGTAPINAPLHKLIVSGGFSFSLRREEDLRAGIYAVYTSKRQASTDPEELSVKLPGYTTTNLFINYAFSPHLDLGIDVTNLFDEDYFSASQSNLLSIVPGPPLTVFSSVRIHF